MKLSRLAVHRGSLFEFLRHHPIRQHLNPLFLCSRNHVKQQALYFALMSFGISFCMEAVLSGASLSIAEVYSTTMSSLNSPNFLPKAALSCDSPKVLRTLPGFWTSPIGTS